MIKTGCKANVLWLLFIGVLAMLGGISPAATAQATGKATMDTATLTATKSQVVPAIDQSTPTTFETASFGLG